MVKERGGEEGEEGERKEGRKSERQMWSVHQRTLAAAGVNLQSLRCHHLTYIGLKDRRR